MINCGYNFNNFMPLFGNFAMPSFGTMSSFGFNPFMQNFGSSPSFNPFAQFNNPYLTRWEPINYNPAVSFVPYFTSFNGPTEFRPVQAFNPIVYSYSDYPSVFNAQRYVQRNFNDGLGGIFRNNPFNNRFSTMDDASTPKGKSKNDKINTRGQFLKGKGKDSAYGPKFLAKVKEISNNLKCDYKDLLAMMNAESGINAKVVGKNGASGLICFMPAYFDIAKIRKMSPLEQLDLVEKTIMDSKTRAGIPKNATLSKGDLYALIFLPARANNEVLAVKGETSKNGKLLRYYEGNAPLDKNKDGKITKSEMAARIDNKYVSDESFYA